MMVIKNIFGIDDIVDLPARIMEVLFGDQQQRQHVYRELLSSYNYDMSFDWFQSLYESEFAERKQKKQDFTPSQLGEICSLLVNEAGSIHEPTAGNGSMIISTWWGRSQKLQPWQHFPSEHMVTCWELSARSIPILLLNMSIRGMMGYVYHGDVLEGEFKTKYILLNKRDDALAFSEIIEDKDDKMKIYKK